MAIKILQRSTFGVKKQEFPVPNLNIMQSKSYEQFWAHDLKNILAEFSPIEDTVGGRWKVELGPEFYLEEDKDANAYQSLLDSKSYSAPFYINITVQNLVTKEKKSQRVFVGNVPLMTPKGNFIINGVQKIVVSQIVKSPGVIYTQSTEKGQTVYSAKVIPGRGIWIDFGFAPDGAMYCRIDRKKKFPATQLLKLFEIVDEEEIKGLFADVDTAEDKSHIDATLAKDNTTSADEAVNSIYKKLRPGDIVSIEQGKKYLKGMFEDPAKYDFGGIGRYMFDKRLGFESEPTEGLDYKKTIGKEEMVAVMRELVRMSVQKSAPDSIDSLSNRRVRGVGEWLGNTFKAGLSRVVKNTKDKMSVNEDTNFTPAQLVNMRPLAAMIEDFFNTSQLSRFMDQTNILSEMDQRQFMTCSGPGGLTRERAGFDVRDVHPSHYGRLCPINTPEGPSFGLNVHAAIYSRVNKLGFLETPYFKVKSELPVTDEELLTRVALEDVEHKGKKLVKAGHLLTQDVLGTLQNADKKLTVKVKQFVSKELVWLSANDELKYIIAEHVSNLDQMGHIPSETIGARMFGNPVQANVEDIELMDVASNQILSLSSCMVPFVAHTDGYRVLMGTNQQGQALPLVKPEQPIVATGFERVAARDSGYVVYAEKDGEVTYADGVQVKVRYQGEKKDKVYQTLKFLPSNDHSTINQRVTVVPGEQVKAGDVLIEGFGVKNGEFAIGQNCRVAFLPFKGYNFEDAVILSERLVQKDKFTSTHIYELVCDVHETRLGDEEITRDIPNVATDKLRNLDEGGVIRIGAYVESGDILVGKITPKGEVDLSPEDKLIRVLFGEYSRDVKDSSLYLEHGLSGKVISIRRFSRGQGDSLPSDVLQRVHIWLATTRKIKPGDKMAGRHGNKGVVSVVLPVEDMPYTADGQPVDIILNPLGVVGRMNLGQLLETHLGLACDKQGMRAITQPLNEIPVDAIEQELEQAGFPAHGKLDLWDGQTGEKYDRPVTVGYLYYNKLHHLVDDKVHTRSTGPYSLVTQQPLGGRSHSGGQRFGEMEVWALEAYGAAYALQEMLTIKSDDVKGRDAAYESIIKEKPIMSPNLPGSFIVLANELTALGIRVNAAVNEAEDGGPIDKKLALSVDEGSLDR